MPNIISIDVGIVKLAFALFNTTDVCALSQWRVINLTKGHTESVAQCCSLCSAKAKYLKDSIPFCAKHGKKTCGLLPSNDLKISSINKLAKEGVIMFALNKFSLILDPSLKKCDLIALVKTYIEKNMLVPIATKTNASKLDLNTIGRNIKQHFDAIFAQNPCDIDEVIIENQIGPQAIRMKTIQGMLSQYFIMRHENVVIKFVNASNKLKNDALSLSSSAITLTETYKDRKELSIQICKHIIQTNDLYTGQWNEFIVKQKKTDGLADLADCFLQGLWYINNTV